MSQSYCWNVYGNCRPGPMLGAEVGKMDKAVLILKVLTTWLCKTSAF